MTSERRTLSLELDPDVERRLQDAAARRGLSVPRYCQTAIEDALEQDEPDQSHKPQRRLSIEEIIARRKERFGGKPLPGNSAELIREERELRSQEIEAAL